MTTSQPINDPEVDRVYGFSMKREVHIQNLIFFNWRSLEKEIDLVMQ